ncbi:TIGR01777 family oxidoreductase [Prosthecobacter sp.]|uniref:TIGR01777 family oxidoreductase n=1 Tax=Prosthecobacter sp. TaxID=1965333 RepID=UPI002AB80E6F|nr:TIGR01777 family oxidoreductase [Prosthecobacter sp.]MDZ4403092.1 TIGR01777 family oxidoreductase [Prosthecobacter sp.]
MKVMRIGITGATGFIGGHLALLAQGSGHEVIAYSRRAGSFVPISQETLYQPKKEPHALPETRLDALVHLSGESLMGLWTHEKRDRIWKSRVDFTEALVAHLGTWQVENRPKMLVCASGAGFYGNSHDKPVDESSPRGGGFLADVCAGWEKAALRAEALGMRVVLLRTGMVLGRDGGAFPLLKRVFGFGLGGRLGSGTQWMSWIHVEDAVQIILKAIETETVRGPVNLCAPDEVTNAEFTQQLAAALKRPALFHAPAFALRLLLRGMADEMLLGGQRVIPRVATEMGYGFVHPTLSSAFKALI